MKITCFPKRLRRLHPTFLKGDGGLTHSKKTILPGGFSFTNTYPTGPELATPKLKKHKLNGILTFRKIQPGPEHPKNRSLSGLNPTSGS
jgi:hypothetical protein